MKSNALPKEINTESVSALISRNYYFFVPYTVLLKYIIASPLLILTQINKGDAIIYFNNWRGSYWDGVFKFYSFVGEGLYFGIFLLIIGIYRFKYAVMGVSLYLASGIVSQILKSIFRIPRPKVFFEGTVLVTYVKDFEIWASNSFPSGHTTAGFTMFLFVAIISRNRAISFVCLLMASMIGISRVYLVQHFLIDIYVGSIIGVVVTSFLYIAFQNSTRLKKKNWYNYSLYNKLMKK